MSNIIKILESKQNLLKVTYSGEFGYFFPSTNLVQNNTKIKSFIDAKTELLEQLKINNVITIPVEFDIDNELFIIQLINYNFKELGVFSINNLGKIKEITDY
ncbi:hypothetical protein [Apilactobacillus micheneri]|uniref:hypothetical protein n=1 Tax=Apilactobacillus micheneri TaxID=1899430 RepID=UPI000D51114E|nr:hypothetical protein [Apilactobacillus micheneri]GAY80212.1 hypothetical protein NBRC113063_01081 [Apilactobacillus micheneri]